jgi:transcriptional regulator with XRE-family HTH domain
MDKLDRRRFHSRSIGDATRRLRFNPPYAPRGRPKANHISQEVLAGLLDTDRKKVVRIEAGLVPPTLDLIEDLARAFQCSPDEFLVSLYAEEPDFDLDPDLALDRLAAAVSELREEDLDAAFARPIVRSAIAAIGLLTTDDIEWLIRVAVALSWDPIAKRDRDLPALLVRDVVFATHERKPEQKTSTLRP